MFVALTYGRLPKCYLQAHLLIRTRFRKKEILHADQLFRYIEFRLSFVYVLSGETIESK